MKNNGQPTFRRPASLHERITSLNTAAWRRARCGSKRRVRQQAISILNRAAWRAERVALRAVRA